MTTSKLDLTQPSGILTPFPPTQHVFVPEQFDLVRHLHPLVSVSLSAANPAWSGWAHILSPLEPCSGNLGGYGRAFHNAYLQENGLVFRIEDGRYRFMGDRRYFLMEQERASLSPETRLDFDELADHYVRAEASYRIAAAAYARNGRLYSLDEEGRIRETNRAPQPLVDTLGGTTGYANWTVGFGFPFEPQPEPGRPEPEAVWPLSPAGRRFEFVASTPGWQYRQDGADAILLFYEPVDALALLTFDGS